MVWATLAALLLAIGAAEYLDRRPRAVTEADARALLSVAVAELGAVEIANRGRLHRFERAADGAWFYHGVHATAAADHTHAPDPVLSERIEQAFAAFGRARTEREFDLHGDAAAYGLTAPEVVILVYRRNESQPLTQYAVGGIAPDTASRYLTVVGRRRVVTIPGYQIENLLSLVQAAGARSEAGVAEAR